jgi:hypothetical protein
MYKQVAATVLLSTLFACSAKVNDPWINEFPSTSGQTGFYYLENAPFPHNSRAEGYTRNNITYPQALHYSDSTVAVFIPAGFNPRTEVTLLYYFHGHNNNVRNAMLEFDLPTMVAESERNVVLVFPEGPVDVPDSSGGKLEENLGLLKLHTELVSQLLDDGKLMDSTVEGIILSGHSGAYKILHNSLSKGGLNHLVREVYLLDASYGGLEDFTNWIAQNPDRRFVSIFTDHLADENNQIMNTLKAQNLPFRMVDEDNAFDHVLRGNQRLFVRANKSDHNQTVKFLQEFLSTSTIPPRGVVN